MMRRSLSTWLLAASLAVPVLGGSGVAQAQKAGDKAKAQPKAGAQPKPAEGEDAEMTFEEGEQPAPEGQTQEGEQQPAGEPEPEPTGEGGEIDLGADPTAAPEQKLSASDRVSWQDIVVVVRKPFLKQRRLEILPQWGITMNDNIIRHYQFSGQLNFFLTDVLAVGLEGQYYIKDLREPYDLVARQARRLPTVNKYNYGAALNFHYVPIYGKFAILDQHIIHWETFFTAGVGFTQSEVIPRDPAYQPFTNVLITPNVGASMRFFVTKFITVNAGIRDYVFVDKFEAVGRTEVNGDAAKNNADSSLINNVVFQAGLSFWFPTSFEYTTFR
jgi:outer membrane beta-barrel protein